MIERRKDESESMGKYQAMLMSAAVALIIVFLAPTLIVVITNIEVQDGQSAEEALFAPPTVRVCVDGASNAPSGYTATGDTCTLSGGGTGEYYSKSILPGGFSGQLQGIFGLLVWIVRIVVLMIMIASVIMLHVRTPLKESAIIQ